MQEIKENSFSSQLKPTNKVYNFQRNQEEFEAES